MMAVTRMFVGSLLSLLVRYRGAVGGCDDVQTLERKMFGIRQEKQKRRETALFERIGSVFLCFDTCPLPPASFFSQKILSCTSP